MAPGLTHVFSDPLTLALTLVLIPICSITFEQAWPPPLCGNTHGHTALALLLVPLIATGLTALHHPLLLTGPPPTASSIQAEARRDLLLRLGVAAVAQAVLASGVCGEVAWAERVAGLALEMGWAGWSSRIGVLGKRRVRAEREELELEAV